QFPTWFRRISVVRTHDDRRRGAFCGWRIVFVWVSLVAGLAAIHPGRAAAGALTDQLRESIDAVLKIVSDPELKKDVRTADRRRMIRRVASQMFDSTEISQRSLGRHWQARTPAEREEFIGLYGDLLEYSYVSKIESYSGETIRYVGEVVDGDLGVVRTRIVMK